MLVLLAVFEWKVPVGRRIVHVRVGCPAAAPTTPAAG